VVVVNWNRRALLEACLRSLERPQGAPFEVVVVDNGSSDGSPDWVEEYAQGAPFRVKLLRNSENRGFCGANNQGIEAASGEWIALLNNDAEAQPGWLAAMLDAAREPNVGMVASKVLVWEDPSVIDKVGHLIYLDGQNRGRGTGQLDQGQFDAREDVLWPDGCACLYRRAMLDEVGLFDEDLFAYGDDADLGLRARLMGWRCVYEPRAVVHHHRGATLGQQNPWRVTLIERNRVLLAVKLFPGSLLWLNGVMYLGRLLGGLWAALTGRGEISRFPGQAGKLAVARALGQGDLEALRMLPRTLEKRRQVWRRARLTGWAAARLLWRHRIGLRELSEASAGRSAPPALPPSR